MPTYAHKVIPHRTRVPDWKLDRAREMRSNPTKAEARLWNFLRCKRIKGFKFRRQEPMFGYIVDFYCPKLNLAIEVDGGIHTQQEEYDIHRDTFIEKCGIKVLRFANDEVMNNIQEVIKRIKASRSI